MKFILESISMNFLIVIIFILAQLISSFFLVGTLTAFNDSILVFGVPIHLILIILLNIGSLILLAKILINEQKRVVKYTEETHEEQFRSLVTSVRSDRHDFNNHLTVISGLIKINNFKSVESYIDEIIGEVKITNLALTIQNPILASILYSKMEFFQKQKVPFILNVTSEAVTSSMSSTDLIRLISNLLDNAYEATIQLPKELQNIVFEMSENNRNYEVIVINSSIDKNFDLKNYEVGVSTKIHTEKRARGYGVSIIQEVAKKYNGTVSTKTEDSLIVFSVILPKGARK